ncbi:hypothetical protein D3C75_920540 [compost metagenome]
MTRRTSFITQLCSVSIATRTRSPFGASSFSNFSAATPRKAAKITTLIMEVGFAPVRSANGFFGTKDRISCGTFRSATLPTYVVSMALRRAVSAVP